MFNNKIFNSQILKTVGGVAFFSIGLLMSVQTVLSSTNQGTKTFVRHFGDNLIAKVVKSLEVGSYNNTKGEPNDKLTGDHIPSGSAVVVSCFLRQGNAESKIPTPIGDLYDGAKTSHNSIYNQANTIVYSDAIHRRDSPTYGGRNKRSQIISDANNLEAAFNRDRAAVSASLTDKKDENGVVMTKAKVDAAFDSLDKLNRAAGVYGGKKPIFCPGAK